MVGGHLDDDLLLLLCIFDVWRLIDDHGALLLLVLAAVSLLDESPGGLFGVALDNLPLVAHVREEDVRLPANRLRYRTRACMY